MLNFTIKITNPIYAMQNNLSVNKEYPVQAMDNDEYHITNDARENIKVGKKNVFEVHSTNKRVIKG